MSLFKSVNVVYCYVKDWEAAKKFYRETLEWPVAWSDDTIGWEEYGAAEATHVAINRWDSQDAMPLASAPVVFNVEDVLLTTNTLRTRGVKCDDLVRISNVVTYGTFYDPEGNRFQFTGAK
jgi:predicted enzyme related to lactoylglutathione lyase